MSSPELLGKWLAIQTERDAHAKLRPKTPEEHSSWGLKREEIRQKLGAWGETWGSRKIENISEFIGWLRDAIDIFDCISSNRSDPPNQAMGSYYERVKWACLKADELGIVDRPALPIATSLTSESVVTIYDALLIASRRRLHEQQVRWTQESDQMVARLTPLGYFSSFQGQTSEVNRDGHESIPSGLFEPPTPATQKPTQADAQESDGRRKLRRPSDVAFAAYRLEIATGRAQTELAEMLSKEFRVPVKQNQVSRMLKQVKRYIKAGNILPELPRPSKRATAIDPERLDVGSRRDGRTLRQRQRQSDPD